MFNIKSLLRQCSLAIVFTAAAAAAQAGPTSFHVAVDTHALPAQTSLISLQFAGTAAATPLSAVISNRMGAFDGVSLTGNVDVTAAGISMSNLFYQDGNFADFSGLFGGLFSFDIAFSGDYAAQMGGEVSSLFISLLDLGLNTLSGTDVAGVGGFDFAQGAAVKPVMADAQFITITPNPDAVVPEPSQWLLMLAGLALLGATLRRRAQG